MVSVIKEILNPPKAGSVSNEHIAGVTDRLTSIDRRNSCLNNDNWKSIETAELGDDLLHGRQLCHHIQKHRHQGAEAQKDGSRDAISLPCPFGEDESFWTFLPDNRTKEGEDQERSS